MLVQVYIWHSSIYSSNANEMQSHHLLSVSRGAVLIEGILNTQLPIAHVTHVPEYHTTLLLTMILEITYTCNIFIYR